jgi:hypothetical protein
MDRQKLFEKIEKQREQVGQVIALLMCLAAALKEFDDPFDGSPFFPDAAQIGIKMLADVHEALEPGVLLRQTPRDDSQ